MTIDDDAEAFAALSKELPAIDVDSTTAEMIARRARQDLGKGPSLRRWILPITAGVATASYAVWTIMKLIEVLG
ncbi:MAG: hypothetical protein H6Q90_1335 [Deltaproteobacteria bacterium]|nr:hypothetical protein [Deltaproteobacteria bacterium]